MEMGYIEVNSVISVSLPLDYLLRSFYCTFTLSITLREIRDAGCVFGVVCFCKLSNSHTVDHYHLALFHKFYVVTRLSSWVEKC